MEYVPPHFDDDEDPINMLGFGIVSYFNLIKGLILTFFILTLLNIPTMYIYATHSGFGKLSTSQMGNAVTLGNMGGSQTKCFSVGMQANSVVLSCGVGLISEIVDFGLQSSIEDPELCTYNKTGTCAQSLNRASVL